MTLAEVLEAAASELPGVERVVGSGDIVLMRGGKAFAAFAPDGASAEFLLDPKVAPAAARTPDTRPSERGPGWVRFTPSVLDPHAVDRATAWLMSAHRRLPPG